MNMTARFVSSRDTVRPAGYFVSGQSTEIGDFVITPYLVDHSAYDSYGFVVQGGGKCVVYTGDLRMHGKKAKDAESSHGAGRRMSRTEAKATFTVENVMSDLNACGVVLGKNNKGDVGEESRYAYKEIDKVIANELDLITPIKKLWTIGGGKG